MRRTNDYFEERNLSEVFEELKKTRNNNYQNNSRIMHYTNYNHNKKGVVKIRKRGISIVSIIACIICVLFLTTFAGKIFASSDNEDKNQVVEVEENRDAVNVEKIISDNISSTERKEMVTEERTVEFQTTYVENSSIPKDEQVVVREGENGVNKVTVIKTYENDYTCKETFLEEEILNTTIIKNPVNKIVEVGTSELLTKFGVHIGDKLYTTESVKMMDSTSNTANVVCEVNQYLDVTITGVQGNYFNVSYEQYTGYIDSAKLVSAVTNPEYVEKCRLQKIFNNVSAQIDVSKPSGLSLEDFKKVLSNNPNDVNKVFENNAEVFYNIETKYNINGLFIAALGIHESAWATSPISKDKHNLFGYGAYDSDPYNSAYTFETYAEGIETVAKSLVKNYLNPAGTQIYDGEYATGKYYNGKTIASINIKYATDENWGNAIYKIMEGLYEKLQK